MMLKWESHSHFFSLTLFSFQFHFFTPSLSQDSVEERFVNFGRMVIRKARISFDNLIDNQSEFDLYCENSELVDSRFDGKREREHFQYTRQKFSYRLAGNPQANLEENFCLVY